MPRRSSRDAIDSFLLRNIRPGSAVLDVGSGYGETALLIARRVPGASVEAVDINAASVHRAKCRFRRLGSRPIRCRRGNAEELARTFGRSRFDYVVVNNALHELWRPVRALRETRSVLRPGGMLLLAEFTPRYGEQADDCPRYSRDKILELIRRAGFAVRSTATRSDAILIRATKR
mgnify:FL=1